MATLLAGAVVTIVFCAPGYPGGTGEAQPYLDAFAAAAAAAAHWPAGSLAATYDATEAGGLEKLAQPEAALAFVPYPFFVEHAAALHLAPLVQADVTGVGVRQRWTLVAKKGRVSGPATISGYTILSVAGYAADFVRNYALASWELPADVKIAQNAQVLSVLRRVAAGDPVAALLDGPQMAALASLPFADDLQAVTQSAPLPAAIFAVVDSRVPKSRVESLRAALLSLAKGGPGAETLANLRLQGFVLPQLPARTAAP
ncbi:MAG TPA: PhnD/SsuA/transferrin family substrate-binding protein [Steroidobacteraceae bacterium]|jgi:hypothetical protein|nr:PhnD/SsuA/transferrin family substrate-binding protein [Steroidobacteraceae bacterium]